MEHPVFAGLGYKRVEAIARNMRNIAAHLNHFGGIRLFRAGPSLVTAAFPFKLVEASFYFVRGQQWLPDPTVAVGFFPFRTDHAEGAIVPIAGGIYIGDRMLTDEELQKIGMTAVRDEAGEKITFPYLIPWGARVMMDPFYRVLWIGGQVLDRGTEYAFASPETHPFIPHSFQDVNLYVAACRRFSGESLDNLIDRVRAKLWSSWEKDSIDGEGVDFKVYRQRFSLMVILNVIADKLAEHNIARLFNSCGIQFKGCGAHYVGRWKNCMPDGSIALEEGEIVLGDSSGNGHYDPRIINRVGRAALVGTFGIYLDQIHQPPPASPDPVGGMLVQDTEAISRDLRLKSHGAVMGGISLASLRLLEAEAIRRQLGLPGYDSGDLYVLCRLAGTDTRRLSHFGDVEFYRKYILEGFGVYSSQAKIAHLTELAKNIGKNIRAAFACRFTVKKGIINGKASVSFTANNLSPTGAIFDSTELIPAKDIDECCELALCWIADLFRVAEAAGFYPGTFLQQTKIFEALFEGFAGLANEVSPSAMASLEVMDIEEIASHLAIFMVNTWKENIICNPFML